MKKYIFIGLGFLFFGLGAVGAVVPVLPTTPFLLLAAGCFTRGSDRFNRWFTATKLYKTHAADFLEHRSMTLKAKICICALASTMMIIAFMTVHNIYMRAALVGLMAFMYYYFIFRIKTVPRKAVATPVAKAVAEEVPKAKE